MRKTLFTLAVALLMSTTAQGGFIDFSLAPSAGKSPVLKFDHSGNFSGFDISVNSVSGQGTPSLDGVTLPTSAKLDFSTGQYQGDLGGSGWLFGPGGYFTITGSFDGSPAHILFSGSFSGTTSIVDVGNGFKVAASGFVGDFSQDLAQAFGVQKTSGPGGFSLLFASNAKPGHYFESGSYQSGNVAMVAVPTPPAAILLLIGLATSGLIRMMNP